MDKKTEESKVDEWNKKYVVGIEVNVTKDNGEVIRTKTNSYATLLSGHTAVIWLVDLRGCYLLDRVKAVEP